MAPFDATQKKWFKELAEAAVTTTKSSDSSKHKKACAKKKITFVYDKSKPNGTPRKVLNIGLAKSYGWRSKHNIVDALRYMYKNFLKNNTK